MELDIETLKQRLLAEEKELKEQLSGLGQQKSEDSDDWDPKSEEEEREHDSDLNVRADNLEEMAETNAVVSDLEIRYKNVTDALERMEKGTYGTCEVSGEPIEPDRLEANPAARTCKAHMDTE